MSDLEIVSQYFSTEDNVPEDVVNAFDRIKLNLESSSEGKSDISIDHGFKGIMDYYKTASELTRNILQDNKWAFSTDNGFKGIMTFLSNGKIGTYSHDNERTWDLVERCPGYSVLELRSGGGKRTCQFISSVADVSGKWRLHGPFAGKTQVKHYLHQI
jgi:hypothetical protein